MQTAKNVVNALVAVAFWLYVCTATAGGAWLMYQPEPSVPVLPGLAMVVAGEDMDVGDGDIFCAYGMAWVETHTMGLNIPHVVDGHLSTCHYAKNVTEWSYRMGPTSHLTEL